MLFSLLVLLAGCGGRDYDLALTVHLTYRPDSAAPEVEIYGDVTTGSESEVGLEVLAGPIAGDLIVLDEHASGICGEHSCGRYSSNAPVGYAPGYELVVDDQRFEVESPARHSVALDATSICWGDPVTVVWSTSPRDDRVLTELWLLEAEGTVAWSSRGPVADTGHYMIPGAGFFEPGDYQVVFSRTLVAKAGGDFGYVSLYTHLPITVAE